MHTEYVSCVSSNRKLQRNLRMIALHDLQVKVVAGEGSILTMHIPGDSGRRQCCSNCKLPVMHTSFAADGRTPTRVVGWWLPSRRLRNSIGTAAEGLHLWGCHGADCHVALVTSAICLHSDPCPASAFHAQTLPVGVITSKAGPRDPAWAPQAHICYSQRARDVLDGTPKWCAPGLLPWHQASPCAKERATVSKRRCLHRHVRRGDRYACPQFVATVLPGISQTVSCTWDGAAGLTPTLKRGSGSRETGPPPPRCLRKQRICRRCHRRRSSPPVDVDRQGLRRALPLHRIASVLP